MDCQWTTLMHVLPVWLRSAADQTKNMYLQEIRLRIGMGPIFVCRDKKIPVQRVITREDLEFCVNTASRYSPWASQSIADGYITVQGGHRIGICGTTVMTSEKVSGIREVSSVCIRVARQFEGIGDRAARLEGNILILGKPGSGKSTLLRDIVRCKSVAGSTICVVDERRELFPYVGNVPCFRCGQNTDVFSGCSKAEGVEMAIRLMNPDIIAVDEITAARDCDALLNAGWCGISLLATAHASSLQDFMGRPIYKPLVESRLFHTLLVLQKDKSWKVERVKYDS